MKTLNLSKGHEQAPADYLTFEQFLDEEPVDRETKETAVWIEIDKAFSRPVARFDDTADYVPTQILAELFRDSGYEALVYRSQFGEKGYNIVLFDIDDAEVISAAPCEVTAIELKFKEIGNRWFLNQQSTNGRSKTPSAQ